ncbi:MAG: SDR family oxidoreductase [Deltaproteobacteria bacterium]|nr:SDR family oxidoreductase [Deltaproteobacteria bacterium]
MASPFRQDLLADQVVIVTGGATGIGAVIAREMATLGAQVVIASRKEEKVARAAEVLAEESGGRVRGFPVDIRDRDSVARLCASVVEEEGRIDCLVNNGGGQFFAPAETITPGGWDAVVQTNLTGTWNMTRGAADAWMFEHGGAIVNITMLTARAFPGMAHSVAARAGVEGMSRTLAVEWAGKGIRINTVAPGYIASSGLKRYPFGTEWIRGLQTFVPQKRLGTMEEVAWAVIFLAGPTGAYMTGQVITLDGGKTLWGDYWQIDDPDPLPEVRLPSDPGEEPSEG